MKRRRVVYAVNDPGSDARTALMLRQLTASYESLRRNNCALPVTILSYGDVELGIDADVRPQGPYAAALGPHAETLGDYRVLHKWLGLAQLDVFEDEQVLYLDNDTYVFGDLTTLFDAHGECDFYAREEPFTMRCPRGYDPEYLDELALSALAYRQGCKAIPPYNLGVVMLNHGLCNRLRSVLDDFLTFAARFTEGTLPYPSSNRWIIEQVALWLALGRIDGLTHGQLGRDFVLQDSEFTTQAATIVHYFSGNTEAFFADRGLGSC